MCVGRACNQNHSFPSLDDFLKTMKPPDSPELYLLNIMFTLCRLRAKKLIASAASKFPGIFMVCVLGSSSGMAFIDADIYI